MFNQMDDEEKKPQGGMDPALMQYLMQKQQERQQQPGPMLAQADASGVANAFKKRLGIPDRMPAKPDMGTYEEPQGSGIRMFDEVIRRDLGGVKKLHNKKLNKTRFIYPDGRVEEKDGIL